MKKHLKKISSSGNWWLAFKVMLVVGTILNCINQGDCIWNGHYEELDTPKMFLTYTVPFLVSFYSSAVVKLKRK